MKVNSNMTEKDIAKKRIDERRSKGLVERVRRFNARKFLIRLALVVGFLAVALTVNAIADWFDYNDLDFQSPLIAQNPVVITPRERKPLSPVVKVTDDILLSHDTDVASWEEIYKMVQDAPDTEIAMMIVTVFGDEAHWFLPTAIAESGLKPNAKNWNCMYGDVSTFCKPEDRYRAWSVDCGVAQLNFSGTECPDESMNPMWNILSAREKFERQGRTAWSAYNNGSYLAHVGQ